jgi:hypothetical protein
VLNILNLTVKVILVEKDPKFKADFLRFVDISGVRKALISREQICWLIV